MFLMSCSFYCWSAFLLEEKRFASEIRVSVVKRKRATPHFIRNRFTFAAEEECHRIDEFMEFIDFKEFEGCILLMFSFSYGKVKCDV